MRRQVQLAKEIKIQQLEELSNKLLNEIDQYEKESIETYLKMNQKNAQSTIEEIKQELDKYNNKINVFKSNDDKKREVLVEKLKEIKAKATIEQDKSKFSFFLNNEILNYKANLIPLNNIAMGCLKRNSYGLIKCDQIFRQDFSKDFLKFKSDLGNGSDQVTEFKIRDTKLLPDNSLIVLADETSYDPYGEGFKHENVHLFIVNQNGRWKCHNCFETEVEDLELDSFIHYSKKKICIQYKSEYENASIVVILNDNLKQVKEVIMNNENLLIGSDEEKLFIFSINEKKPIQIYNWKLECIGEMGQSKSSKEPFYIPEKTKQLIPFTEDGIKYWILFSLAKEKFTYSFKSEVRIISESDGILRKVFDTNNARRVSIDSKNNIIIFYWDKIVYYNSDGLLLKEIRLVEPEVSANNAVSNDDSDHNSENEDDDEDDGEDNDDDDSKSESNNQLIKSKEHHRVSLKDVYSHKDYLYYFDSEKFEFAIL